MVQTRVTKEATLCSRTWRWGASIVDYCKSLVGQKFQLGIRSGGCLGGGAMKRIPVVTSSSCLLNHASADACPTTDIRQIGKVTPNRDLLLFFGSRATIW